MLKIKKVNEDKRGAIYTIVGDDLKELKEIVLLVTKEGFARGGCVHNNSKEHFIVVEGEVEYHIGRSKYRFKTGCKDFICKKIPHYFKSLTDSIVIEFGVNPEEKGIKDEEMKKLVDEINAEA
jgi:mannose-6-phosphate isomerase-like protein (cupin superfamily)